MARIRGRNTKPEIRLRRALWASGLRYQLHAETPAGRPDVVFPGRRVSVFVDGCQWHGCPEHYVRPRTRGDFWASKLRENVMRDHRQTLALESAGWRVCRFWEHDIDLHLDDVLTEIRAAVTGTAMPPQRRVCVIQVEPLGANELEARYLVDLRNLSDETRIERHRTTRKW